MNHSECAALLTLAARIDKRTVGEQDVEAWVEILDDVDFSDARLVLRGHYRSSTEWLMPAHVVQGVRALRRERLDAAGDAAAYAGCDDLTGEAFAARVRANRERIASGRALSALEGGVA